MRFENMSSANINIAVKLVNKCFISKVDRNTAIFWYKEFATPDFKIYGNSGRNSSEIYGATKAGVIHVTKYLAAYLAKHNILANSISPGGVFNHQDPNFVRKYKAKTPLGRMAEPEDLTGLIAFLCSDDARYITGQNIAVDGGFTL